MGAVLQKEYYLAYILPELIVHYVAYLRKQKFCVHIYTLSLLLIRLQTNWPQCLITGMNNYNYYNNYYINIRVKFQTWLFLDVPVIHRSLIINMHENCIKHSNRIKSMSRL